MTTNFLSHVLPYLELDPQTALVQTPQHFFNVDHTGDVFNHQNATFFFGCQTGLDSWRATVCCGTNFAVRAAPLTAEELAGVAVCAEDFEAALERVQPSATREGFATVPDVTWAQVGAMGTVREELDFAIARPIRQPELFAAMGLSAGGGVLAAVPEQHQMRPNSRQRRVGAG